MSVEIEDIQDLSLRSIIGYDGNVFNYRFNLRGFGTQIKQLIWRWPLGSSLLFLRFVIRFLGVLNPPVSTSLLFTYLGGSVIAGERFRCDDIIVQL